MGLSQPGCFVLGCRLGKEMGVKYVSQQTLQRVYLVFHCCMMRGKADWQTTLWSMCFKSEKEHYKNCMSANLFCGWFQSSAALCAWVASSFSWKSGANQIASLNSKLKSGKFWHNRLSAEEKNWETSLCLFKIPPLQLGTRGLYDEMQTIRHIFANVKYFWSGKAERW